MTKKEFELNVTSYRKSRTRQDLEDLFESQGLYIPYGSEGMTKIQLMIAVWFTNFIEENTSISLGVLGRKFGFMDLGVFRNALVRGGYEDFKFSDESRPERIRVSFTPKSYASQFTTYEEKLAEQKRLRADGVEWWAIDLLLGYVPTSMEILVRKRRQAFDNIISSETQKEYDYWVEIHNELCRKN